LEEERKVDAIRGQELAAKFDCPFMETSAKTNTNVKEAFESLVKLVIAQKGGNPEGNGEGKKKTKRGCIIS
jgi:GTPase KRas